MYALKALFVAETAQSVTLVAGATPLEREISLAEIDQLWVIQKEGVNTATKVAGYVLMGIGALALFVVIGYSIQGEPRPCRLLDTEAASLNTSASASLFTGC